MGTAPSCESAVNSCEGWPACFLACRIKWAFGASVYRLYSVRFVLFILPPDSCARAMLQLVCSVDFRSSVVEFPFIPGEFTCDCKAHRTLVGVV